MRKLGAVLVWAVMAGAFASQPAFANTVNHAVISAATHHTYTCKDGTKVHKKKQCKKHGGVTK